MDAFYMHHTSRHKGPLLSLSTDPPSPLSLLLPLLSPRPRIGAIDEDPPTPRSAIVEAPSMPWRCLHSTGIC
jgi:hypothetical protein